MKKVFFISAAVILVFLISSCVFLYKLGDKVIEMSLEAAIQSELDKAIEEIEDEIEFTEPSSDYNEQNSNGMPIIDLKDGEINTSSEKIDTNNKNTEGKTTGIKKDVPNGSNKQSEQKTSKSVITAQKVKEVKDEITISEKARVSIILIERLKMEDINELKGMLPDGITEDEKKRAKEIVYSRLTNDELDEIRNIYQKYMYSEPQ